MKNSKCGLIVDPLDDSFGEDGEEDDQASLAGAIYPGRLRWAGSSSVVSMEVELHGGFLFGEEGQVREGQVA